MTGPPASVGGAVAAGAGATRLTLVRHGESRCNAEGRVGGMLGCTGLTDEGVAQAQRLRDRLLRTDELRAATAFVTSVLPRAIETAEIIAAGVGDGRLELDRRCELCELHPGEADGLAWDQFAARYGEPDWDADPTTVVSPGGESWSGFVARAAAGLEDVRRRAEGGWAVVVCHGGVIEASLIALLPAHPAAGRLKLRTRYVSITEWEHDHGAWRLLRYNDAAHRDAAPAGPEGPAAVAGVSAGAGADQQV